MHGICCGKPFQDDEERIAWLLVPREEPKYMSKQYVQAQKAMHEEKANEALKEKEVKEKEKKVKEERRKDKGKGKDEGENKEKKALAKALKKE